MEETNINSQVLANNREARAIAQHIQVLELVEHLQERWFHLAELLHPIHEEKLFLELGFKTWTQYVMDVFHEPVQTINNYLMPYRKLLQSGIDPSRVADVPMAHVNELAAIAKANGGQISDELLDKAKSARTQKESREFQEMIATERKHLGIETPRKIEVTCAESLHELWRLCLRITANIDGSKEVERKHSVLLMECLLVDYIQTDLARETLARMTDKETLGALSRLSQGDPLE